MAPLITRRSQVRVLPPLVTVSALGTSSYACPFFHGRLKTVAKTTVDPENAILMETHVPSEEEVHTVDDLKQQKRFEILTPEQAREKYSAGGADTAVLHPLAGGVPLDRAWYQLRLFCEEVLRPLQKEPNP